MKPIKLIISGIGPYAKEMPEISFDDFGEKGLFLISGDTGAGKTTIFDAICFALYGTVSGSYRDTKNLRSEYAKEDVKSFVDFYFSHQGKNYHILRTPPYERAKKRGSGVIEEKESACFYEENATPIEGIFNVNKAVYELLHIDEKQFKQIAMIAQGEFLSLLNAKTDERTDILRTIFSTTCYRNVEFKLKDRMDAANKSRSKKEISISQYFSDVLLIDESVFKNEFDELSKKISAGGVEFGLEGLFEMIQNINKENKEQLELCLLRCEEAEKALKQEQEKLTLAKVNNAFLERLELLEKEERELKEEKLKIESIKSLLAKQKTATRMLAPVYQNLTIKQKEKSRTEEGIKSKKEQLKENLASEEEAKSKLTDSMQNKELAENKKREAQKIEEEKEDYKLRDRLKEEIKLLREKKANLDLKKASLELSETKLEERTESLKNIYESLKSKPEEYKDVVIKSKALNDVDEKIKLIELRLKDISKSQNQQIKIEADYKSARESFDEADKERANAEKILEYSRAGILAKGLKEGMSCPVCGSTHHPDPATLPEVSISEEEFKQLKNKAKKLEEDKNKLLTGLESLNALLLEKEEGLKREFAECIKSEFFESSNHLPQNTDEISTRLISLRDELKCKNDDNEKLAALLKKQCAELKKAEEGLEQAREVEKKEILRQKELLLKDIQDNDYILSKNTGTLESLQKLSFDNWESAEKARDKAYNEAKNIINEIEKWEERKNTAAREVAAIKAKISTMEETLEKQCVDEEELSKKLQDLLNQYDFNSLEEIREFTLSEEDISGKEDLIAKFNERVSVNESKLIQAREDAKGKRKVDIKELEESVKVKNNEAALMRSTVSAISFKIDSNNEKYKNIKEQSIELEKFSKEYNICKRLYNLVKGQTGNGKITLEQYVQAAGFDAIIRAANRRLLPMSEGQYELYRTKDSLGKKSNTFLDLEALDNYTGHRRPVGNLSGGESFKASLSLALGLSDTVSSNLGGVQMDALFIDEGFGTLDKKSIENAMDILLSLSGTNKLVGIISHREELKDNIPQKILIEKTREGSDIRVERD